MIKIEAESKNQIFQQAAKRKEKTSSNCIDWKWGRNDARISFL